MENLGIDSKLLLAQLINFALFLFIFKRFVSKPFLEFVRRQKKKDQASEKLLNDLKLSEEKMLKKEAEIVKEAQEKAQKIVAEAKADAAALKKEILSAAQKEADEVREKAKKILEREREEMLRAEKEKIFELSVFLLKSTLAKSLTPDERKKITQELLKNSRGKIDVHEN